MTHEQALFFEGIQDRLEAVDALRDREIDLSDNPEATPEMFAKAIVRHGLVSVPSLSWRVCRRMARCKHSP